MNRTGIDAETRQEMDETPAVTTFQDIVVDIDGPVMTIRIDRPEVRNACRIRTLDELCRALAIATADPTVRAVILCGSGDKAFCAGADLKEFQAFPPSMSVEQRMRGWWALLEALTAMRKPVIAAIRGHAVGGGTEIALVSHVVIASETARFGLPEILRGHIPGAAGTVHLPRRMGDGPGLYYLMTGEDIPADVALRSGIATRIVPDDALETEARALALHLAAQAPVAIAALIEAVTRGRDMTVDEAIALERKLCVDVRNSEDFWEGINAFVEKRAPVYGKDAEGKGKKEA